MILKSALEKTQKSGAQYYNNLAQIFESNQLIHETWVAMANDMAQHASGLETLPASLWKKLRESNEPLLEELKTSSEQVGGRDGVGSLHASFQRTLNFEEPLILKAYVPIIRQLRAESRDRALEFYIMVKAHVTRLFRLIQLFEGDPGVLRRMTNLQERFEQEVQAPDPSVVIQTKRRQYTLITPVQTQESKKPAKSKSPGHPAKAARRPLPLGGRKLVAKHAKPLVGKLELRRTRARG